MVSCLRREQSTSENCEKRDFQASLRQGTEVKEGRNV